jgi:hypothetical protein
MFRTGDVIAEISEYSYFDTHPLHFPEKITSHQKETSLCLFSAGGSLISCYTLITEEVISVKTCISTITPPLTASLLLFFYRNKNDDGVVKSQVSPLLSFRT